jgi:hypothetical protein
MLHMADFGRDLSFRMSCVRIDNNIFCEKCKNCFTAQKQALNRKAVCHSCGIRFKGTKKEEREKMTSMGLMRGE